MKSIYRTWKRREMFLFQVGKQREAGYPYACGLHVGNSWNEMLAMLPGPGQALSWLTPRDGDFAG